MCEDQTRILFRASSILSLTRENPEPAGFLLHDGRVEDVFYSEREVDRLSSRDDVRTVDRGASCICPGFADAHTHLKWLADAMQEVDLSGLDSYDEIREAMVARVQEQEDPSWLRGRGWSRERASEDRLPNWRDLKHPQLADVPVALAARDHHAYWVNRTALEVLGIDRTTPDPEGGEIVREENGAPTGVLKEKAVDPLVHILKQERRQENTAKRLNEALQEVYRNGITCVHDIGRLEHLKGYRTLLKQGEPLPPIGFFFLQEDRMEIEKQSGVYSDLEAPLVLAGLKLYADGTLSSRTAAMLEPYEEGVGDGERGTLVNDPEEMRRQAQWAAEKGLSTAIHAIGDRAVRISLDLLSDAYVEGNDVEHAPRIEHAQRVSPGDMDRFAASEIAVSLQPCHMLEDRSTAERLWGDRCARAFPIRELEETGATLMFGSDAPIEPLDPLRNLQAAVHRGRTGDTSWHPEQSISIETALLLHCRKPVQYLNLAPYSGTIQPGTAANFIVLSDDPRAVRPDRISSIDVLETYLHGECVYRLGGR